LWVIFALLDPDPDLATKINADPCGYQIAILTQNITSKSKQYGMQTYQLQNVSAVKT
jgi:hypothetical protein